MHTRCIDNVLDFAGVCICVWLVQDLSHCRSEYLVLSLKFI